MNYKIIICRIIEKILSYQEKVITLERFLDDTIGLYNIIEKDASLNMKKDFHTYWDILEEFFATGTEISYTNKIYNEVLPGFIDIMKKYI